MKYEDTVMPDENIYSYYLHDWPDPELGDDVVKFINSRIGQFAKEVATSQANGSFKAGMQEVVDWVMEHQSVPYELDLVILRGDWRAKLKEWGIEGDSHKEAAVVEDLLRLDDQALKNTTVHVLSQLNVELLTVSPPILPAVWRAVRDATLRAVVERMDGECDGVAFEHIDGVNYRRHYPGRQRWFCPACRAALCQAAGKE